MSGDNSCAMFRPPNYQTPAALLREPYTPSDAFYGRWYAGLAHVALSEWRLRVGGPAADSLHDFTIGELRRFKRREIVAIDQCSGTRTHCRVTEIPLAALSPFGARHCAWKAGVAISH